MEIRFNRIKKKVQDIILWHYTSPEVLWKMLSGEFYATHYRFMNDSAEIRYGIQVLDAFLKKDESLRYLQFLLNDLQKTDFFLWCFSEYPDNLYHWRSYTPKGGFSIGFSYNGMCDIFNNIYCDLNNKIQPHYYLVHCKYLPEDEIAVFMQKATRHLTYAFKCLPQEDKSLFDQSVAAVNSGDFSESINFLTKSPKLLKILKCLYPIMFRLPAQYSAFKNPSFEVESEHRLVIAGTNLRTQTEYIGNKPRIKIPLPELSKCIKGVYVSPHGDVEQNHLLAEIAKERFGLDFEIHRSLSSFNGE